MAEQINSYLKMDTLYGPMGPNKPNLTLGGYLMREHRLLALKDTLTEREQDRLLKARQAFENVVMEWVVATETKALKEIDSRLRQWQETIRDLRESIDNWNYYPTAVESRVMLQHLISMLSSPPFKIDPEISGRLAVLDQAFYASWFGDASKFVWEDDWAVAYPAADFEFLFGQPRNLSLN